MFNWLKTNSEAIRATAAIIQSIAILGGILAAVNEFIWSGKTEERQRVQYTIPFIEKAYRQRFDNLREKFTTFTVTVMGDKLAGMGYDQANPDHIPQEKLMPLERDSVQTLIPLDAFYVAISQCVATDICSKKASFQALCLDATQHYEDIKEIRRHSDKRWYRWTQEIESQVPSHITIEKEKIYSRLRGLEMFSELCLKWNKSNPDATAHVADGPFRAP